MLDDHYARLILQEFQALIYRLLRQYSISPYQSDYPDLVQELRIKLCQIAQDFDGQPLQNADDRYRFIAFASKGLTWKLLNLFKQAVPETPCSSLDLDAFSSELPAQNLGQASLLLGHYTAQARELLNQREFILYLALIQGELSPQEMMDLLEIKRSAFYEMKQRIAHKLAPIYQEIKDPPD
ncbi:sigma-70 family RNA polymerase sigma factor [Facklamia lactis]|uniref:sigma-70 family RNA polymerase sigma factor n=1 Tax=Facklamia lactis TaxID=2749967 RepID=UPI0018CD9B17|nr:sigma-70 family RNA polymerase sigma factor [Facklamia lactis]MBG9981038.1 sigma-70 family RNA polymerase sigma factor [Facklamia lactis]